MCRECGLKKCLKLSKSHVNPNIFEKMVVPLATQLFSRSVATRIAFYREMGISSLANIESTEKLTSSLNVLFDELNANLPNCGLKHRCRQYKILKNFLADMNQYYFNEDRFLEDVLFASHETLVALNISIASTIEIIDYLCLEMSYNFVLTGKINQDCLEKFFGII